MSLFRDQVRSIVERIDAIQSMARTSDEVERLAPMLRQAVIEEGLRSSPLRFTWEYLARQAGVVA